MSEMMSDMQLCEIISCIFFQSISNAALWEGACAFIFSSSSNVRQIPVYLKSLFVALRGNLWGRNVSTVAQKGHFFLCYQPSSQCESTFFIFYTLWLSLPLDTHIHNTIRPPWASRKWPVDRGEEEEEGYRMCSGGPTWSSHWLSGREEALQRPKSAFGCFLFLSRSLCLAAPPSSCHMKTHTYTLALKHTQGTSGYAYYMSSPPPKASAFFFLSFL